MILVSDIQVLFYKLNVPIKYQLLLALALDNYHRQGYLRSNQKKKQLIFVVNSRTILDFKDQCLRFF